jgi:uncharacterized protein DUF4279
MHEYSVDLTIVADELDEAELSRLLGLKASVFHKKGEPLSQRTKRESCSWSFFIDPPEGDRYWHSLEEGLKCLIERLQSLKDILRELRANYSLHAYCGHFGSGFGGGPSISSETLRMLADWGLTLTIKTYWGSTEPE